MYRSKGKDLSWVGTIYWRTYHVGIKMKNNEEEPRVFTWRDPNEMQMF